MTVALVLGGAACVWEDIEAATDLGEYDGVIACNDIGTIWAGELDAWLSFHADKMADWMAKRAENGHPPAKRTYMAKVTRDRHATKTFPVGVVTDHAFEGQVRSGSSGLFAVKVALEDLGFDKAVCCGIPLVTAQAHYFSPTGWRQADHYRLGWQQAKYSIKDRVRSMSGWTREFLGAPTPEWLAA